MLYKLFRISLFSEARILSQNTSLKKNHQFVVPNRKFSPPGIVVSRAHEARLHGM